MMRLLRLWRIGAKDLRLLWFALRHRRRPVWLLPLAVLEYELITAIYCFELSLTRAIGCCPPELKGDPATAVSLPEAAVRVKRR